MADEENGKETTPRANDWEVVSLTASIHAAAPSLVQVAVINDDADDNTAKENEARTYEALLMSGHFAYPQKEPEKLHFEPKSTEVSSIHENIYVISEVSADEGGMSKKEEDKNWNEIQLFNEKDSKFKGETTFEELNLIEKELSLCGPTVPNEEEIVGHGLLEPIEGEFDLDLSKLQTSGTEDDSNVSGYPCQAWWKKQSFALYAQAKEANAFLSIFVAATVMGLVILRQHWQLDSWQVLQLRWQFCISNEKMGWMLSPLSRFKDVLVGGNKEGLLTGSNSLANN